MPTEPTIERSVSAQLQATVTGAPEVLVSIAVASNYERSGEVLSVTLNGNACEVTEISAPHGGRLHLLRGLPDGQLVVDYQVTITGTSEQQTADDLEQFHYLRPSRYCESDRIGPLAQAEFDGLRGFALVNAVRQWVNTKTRYVLGSSRPTDSAVVTLLEGQGVCRDFAHLTAALLRANDMPARVVSVYAPGLVPMDFHSVVEACVDGLWYLIDATGLAPRASMVRIATGVDSSETAFLTTVRGNLTLSWIGVGASGSPQTLVDDGGLTFLW